MSTSNIFPSEKIWCFCVIPFDYGIMVLNRSTMKPLSMLTEGIHALLNKFGTRCIRLFLKK